MPPSVRLALRNSSSPASRSSSPPQNGRRRRQWRKPCQASLAVATYVPPSQTLMTWVGPAEVRSAGPRWVRSVALDRLAVFSSVDLGGQAGERESARRRGVRGLVQVVDVHAVGLLAEHVGAAVGPGAALLQR